MGKPPREKLRGNPNRTLSDQVAVAGPELPDEGKNGNSDANVAPSIGLVVGHVPVAWDVSNESPMVNLETWPSLPESDSLEFNEFAFSDASTNNLQCKNVDFESMATPYSTQLTASQSRADESPHADGAAMSVKLSEDECCNCPQQANDIFTSLYCLNLGQNSSIPLTATSSASDMSPNSATESSSLDRVPLDHVLRLNRDASERLGCLIECPCANTPHVALLYASIISRILVWYQQAAGCTQNPSSRNHAASTASSTATSFRTNTWASTPSTGFSVPPAKMAIGNFNVDDLRVESALKMQLLAGEMKRAGHLVDKFTSHYSSSQNLTEEAFLGGADSLYSKLDSWLRREHSRIDNMIRSRLRELNT